MISLLLSLIAANGVKSQTFHWTDSIVPFKFDRTFTEELEPESLIGKAMKETEKSTCVRFGGHTTEPDYIVIVAGPK